TAQCGIRGPLVTGVQTCALPILCSSAGNWPQWRGPTRTGHVEAGTAVPTALPKEPKILWRVSVGGGHASVVVADGTLVCLDEDEIGRASCRDGMMWVAVCAAETA